VAEHDVGKSKTTLNFRFVSSETIDPMELQSLRVACVERQVHEGEKLSARQSSEATELAFQRKYLGDATLSSLLSALESCDSAGGESETQLYLKARALIYLQPEVSDALGRLLHRASARSRKTAVLVSALGAVGNNDAQAALVTAIRARADDQSMLQRLLLALGECDLPSQATEDAFRKWMIDNGPGTIPVAAQILGGMARKLAATSPERASKLIDLLLENLATVTSPTPKQAALLALGATGSDRALREIETFLHADDTDTRTAAVAALRSYDAGGADNLLFQVLESDTAASVRLESALVLGERTMTAESFEGQQRLFATEKDAEVRLSLLNNLWQARNGFPEALRFVQRAAEKDTSKDVQEAARALLSKSS